MKKILLFFFLALCGRTLCARTWVVAPGTALPGINDAIGRARPYDTILVRAGTYREGGITVRKPLILIGEGWPVLDGEHRYQPVGVRSNYVSISGFRVIQCGSGSLEDQAGIKVYNARHVYVFNNVLEDNYFGVYLSNSKNCWVGNNRISANGEV